jgi:diguanylate cyclase (GGDEF)-like protein/PAS domain S-box-containing protein
VIRPVRGLHNLKVTGQNHDRKMVINDAPLEDVSVTLERDAAALIISAGAELSSVLGWHPEDLVGRPSTDFIHPEDQPSAIAAWFQMIDAPGETRVWEGRYRTSGGEWRWVECININRLEDPTKPVVLTEMRRANVDQVSMADELRARKQLLSRLSDAMPIGMFQINTELDITFTNDRLLVLLGTPGSATLISQFSGVTEDDWVVLNEAVGRVLADEAVDDIELRFIRGEGNRLSDERVCVLSMRPLTDGAGCVTGAVGCIADVTESVQLRRELEMRAATDVLTLCYNRAAIFDVLSSRLRDRPLGDSGLAVVFVDLCRFKEINDNLGHAVGDKLLRITAERLSAVVREEDSVGRIGGDEFLVVCPDVESETDALDLGERVRTALLHRISLGSEAVELRASIGVSWAQGEADADYLVAQADKAMYKAKRDGSAHVEVLAAS